MSNVTKKAKWWAYSAVCDEYGGYRHILGQCAANSEAEARGVALQSIEDCAQIDQVRSLLVQPVYSPRKPVRADELC